VAQNAEHVRIFAQKEGFQRHMLILDAGRTCRKVTKVSGRVDATQH
jgi:hypothetical protein